jgi:hypothetical protein
MSIEIDGSGVITGVDSLSTPAVTNAAGSASAPSITFTGDSNTGIYSPAADTIAFTEGGVESVRFDSSGRVGIGTTSPTQNLSVAAAAALVDITSTTGTNFNGLELKNTSGSIYLGIDSSTGSFYGAGNYGRALYSTGAYPLVFFTNGTQRAQIDSSGRLLVGTSTAFNTSELGTVKSVGIEGIATYSALSLKTNSANPTPSYITLGKSRGTSSDSKTVVIADDYLGSIAFEGADGAAMRTGATIEARVDGTPGSGDMPGRLVFSTTADGAGSPTERLRIQSSGDLRIANSTTFYPTTDNAVSLGSGPTGPFRFSAVWAANGTIQTSDERDKTEIVDAQLGADFIKALRPVSYKWIEGGKVDTGERDEDGNYVYESVPGTRIHWGFIAQEVKQVVDSAGVDFGGWVLTDKNDPDSQQALRYDQFIAPLTKALQETMAELEALKAEVAALKAS